MNSVLKEDLDEIVNSNTIDWNNLKDKSIFITGATGLIGSILVKALLMKNKKENLNIKLFLLVRNEEEANKIFPNEGDIYYIISSVENYEPQDLKIDYIIHGASPTKSKFFIEEPVETMDISIIGTKKILEQAKKSDVKSMIYLSSMEMYGTMESEDVKEADLGYINQLAVRSSYSEGKRVSELYCYSYFSEYDVPVKIARIAQTFGAGISKRENRVYKIFADAIINEKDIVLKSTGSTIINFSYTTDTIIGILTILLNGKNGEAYNLVADKTNMTILDSAKWLVKEFGNGKSKVVIDIPKENAGFAPDNKMILNNDKIKSIGWKPKHTLKDGYNRLIKYMLEEKMNDIGKE